MVDIKYVGLDDAGIDAMQRHEIESITQKHAEKIGRIVHNELELVIHVKAYDKSGERRKFSVHARATYPGGTLTSEKAEWKILNALQESLEAIEMQIATKFRR